MRKPLILASTLLLLPWPTLTHQAAPPAQAAQPAKSAAATDLTNLLDARIKAEWEAFKKKDKKAYADLLAEDYVAVEADGDGERNKQHMLREIEHSMITDYAISFLKVTPLGPDAAFARYEVFFRFPSKSAVPFEKVLIGELWVRRGGQWKALHYQETRVK
jgi:ketosteroid isomerase-like protein